MKHRERHPVDVEGKACGGCGEEKSLDDFWAHSGAPDGKRYKCKPCLLTERKERGRHRELKSHLLRHYGLSLEDYEALLDKQDGKCAICGEAPSGRYLRLAVDHNHQTGEVRALLCDRCNRGLGQFKDDIELMKKAIEYLEEYA